MERPCARCAQGSLRQEKFRQTVAENFRLKIRFCGTEIEFHRRKRRRPRCAPAQASATEEAKIILKGQAGENHANWPGWSQLLTTSIAHESSKRLHELFKGRVGTTAYQPIIGSDEW